MALLYTLSDTEKYAHMVASEIQTGTTLALYGPLGSGKTTFSQYFATAFGVARVTSPTFVLMNVYPLQHPTLRALCHVDAYRVRNSQELLRAGLVEYFSDPQTLCLIEWADRIADILPEQRIDLRFSYNKNTTARMVEMKNRKLSS